MVMRVDTSGLERIARELENGTSSRSDRVREFRRGRPRYDAASRRRPAALSAETYCSASTGAGCRGDAGAAQVDQGADDEDPHEEHKDRKSTRLNSSHLG